MFKFFLCLLFQVLVELGREKGVGALELHPLHCCGILLTSFLFILCILVVIASGAFVAALQDGTGYEDVVVHPVLLLLLVNCLCGVVGVLHEEVAVEVVFVLSLLKHCGWDLNRLVDVDNFRTEMLRLIIKGLLSRHGGPCDVEKSQ